MARIVTHAFLQEVKTLSNYTRGNSRNLSARITKAQYAQVRQLAAKHGTTIGALTREAVTRLTITGTDPDGMLRDLARVLGLPPDSEPEIVLEAVMAVVEAITSADPAPGSDPLSQNPDVPPAKLSASDRALAAKMAPAARAKFIELRSKYTTPIKRVVQSKPKVRK